MTYRIPKSILQLQDTMRNLQGININPITRWHNELLYTISHQRWETLRLLIIERSLNVKQIAAYESKLRSEGVRPGERSEIMENLHPCMDCGDPVYVKPDPSVAGEGSVNCYAVCKDCYTPVGRLFKKIKTFFKRSN